LNKINWIISLIILMTLKKCVRKGDIGNGGDEGDLGNN
jgi:hypothetical protein